MISLPVSTKAKYKEDTRQISVFGFLYLARKRMSRNLFTPMNDVISSVRASYSRSNSSIYVGATGTNQAYNYVSIKLDTAKVLGKTIHFSANYTSNVPNATMNLYTYSGSTTSGQLAGQETYNTSGQISFTYTFPATLPSNITGYVIIFYASCTRNASSGQYSNFSNIMVAEDDTSFEEYNTIITDYTEFPLTEENECKILSFNINEKTDVYYTSLPYNTMSIVVDNEKGYFTDYDPDSILNKLNKDCYVIVDMHVGDDYYAYPIMKMNFDEITSSDYEKATLTFKSNISTLSTLPLKDKYGIFAYSSNVYKWDLQGFLYDNYNITMYFDNTSNDLMCQLTNRQSMSVDRLILEAGTRYGTLEKAVLTINDSENYIRQRLWGSSPQDTITLDQQQEKPIVKREDVYRGLHKKYISSGNWQSSTETFNYTITGKLSATNEKIVLYNPNYRLDTITSSNITITGNVSVYVSAGALYELVEFGISGEIGETYTITINKENITKKVSDNYAEQDIGSTDDTTKTLIITEEAPLLSGYYDFILNEKKIKSNIEAKIFGLPYLEVGDTIELETENAMILMTITEIDMNFDGGLLETIRGYELGWDALFPSDTLYPSNDLLPNTPL